MNKIDIKNIAISMIKKHGLINLSRVGLCQEAGIPAGSFQFIMSCTFSDFVSELKNEIPHNNITIHRVSKRRVDPTLRRDNILNVAIEMAKTIGYDNITRDAIAEKAGVSAGLISHYFNTMIQLRRAIIRTAIQKNIPEIIAQGLVNKDSHAQKASTELKVKAANILLTTY